MIRLVKCNLTIGRQQTHVNAIFSPLETTDEIAEYTCASYTNSDLGEVTPNEHSTSLSVMNRKGTNHSAVFSHMITQCV